MNSGDELTSTVSPGSVTTTATPTTTPTASTTCPAGRSQFEGNCYKYFDNSVQWEDARDHCLLEKVLMI